MKEPASKIRLIRLRGFLVILDADLARLYGIETRALNQAARRNIERFPEDFMFQLSREEWSHLRSQFVISSAQPIQAENDAQGRSKTAMTSKGGRRTPPFAFTEHGALMASNVLNSADAVKMSVFIVRAFIAQREALAANAAILRRLTEIDKALLLHDSALRDLYQKLMPLLQPPPEPPRKKIGFRVREAPGNYGTARTKRTRQ